MAPVPTRRFPPLALGLVLGALLLAIASVSVRIGSTGVVDFGTAWQAVCAAVGLGEPTAGTTQTIVELHLWRTLVATGVGAGLALAGALLQGVFRNGLASPAIIGVTSGAGLGASLAILILGGYGSGILVEAVSGNASYMVTGMAFAGAIGVCLIVTALAASLLNSASNPARNTILNIVAKNRLQFAISLSTGIGSIATMAGTKAAGELDSIGLENVLYLQAALFVVGGFFAALLKPGETPVAQAGRQSMIANIRDGLVYVWRFRLARDIIGLNCLSSFFNAGAWMVAIPFIVKETYGGDAVMLANINVVFYFGSLIANFGLLRFMPLLRPGRLYLIMQVTRIAVLALIWIEPPLWVMWIAAAYWGFNMGVTTTMSRLMVQEIAEPEYRARTMSVFTLGLMSATPIGSLVLGFVIGSFGPLNALIPGMVASLLIFAAGVLGTSIWRYHSPEPA